MTQYAAEFRLFGSAEEGKALVAAVKEPGWTATAVGARLVMSFPAESNYLARTTALRVQDVLAPIGVASARIREHHFMFPGPWYDLNEEAA